MFYINNNKIIAFLILLSLILSSCTNCNFKKNNNIQVENKQNNLLEYSKEDLATNVMLFEKTKLECYHMKRKYNSQSCSNLSKIISEVYKQEALLNMRRENKNNNQQYPEYSKEDLAKNVLLFEKTRQECLHMEREHNKSQSCHNLVKLYAEIYKQELQLNPEYSKKDK